eukprot:12413518-Karenia_brevis.AAC.2
MFHQYHSYDELRTGMYVDQRKITLRRMRQWLGQKLVLAPAAEEELLHSERSSSRVPISSRLKDYQEPESVDEVRNINSWAEYVIQVLGPRCDDPIYILGHRHITILDYVRAVWPVVGRAQHEVVVRALAQLVPFGET